MCGQTVRLGRTRSVRRHCKVRARDGCCGGEAPDGATPKSMDPLVRLSDPGLLGDRQWVFWPFGSMLATLARHQTGRQAWGI